jgi:hypothetical protein
VLSSTGLIEQAMGIFDLTDGEMLLAETLITSAF